MDNNFSESRLFRSNIIRRNPNYANVWNFKGNLWFSLEQYKKALESFEKAVELEPNVSGYKQNIDAASKLLHLM